MCDEAGCRGNENRGWRPWLHLDGSPEVLLNAEGAKNAKGEPLRRKGESLGDAEAPGKDDESGDSERGAVDPEYPLGRLRRGMTATKRKD